MALLFANIILKGISLISGPIFTRIMPTEQYGIVSTFTSWQSLFNVIVTLNLASGAFNNGMLDFKDDRDVFQFSLVTISTVTSLLFLAVVIALRSVVLNLLELPELSIYLMFLHFLFVPAYDFWSGRQRYEFKYKALSLITIGHAILALVIGLLVVLNIDSSKAAIGRICALESVSIAIGAFFFFYLGKNARFKVNLQYCVYALKFNVPLLPHYLSMYVLSSSDRIMITKMINSSATAIYSVAYTVASVITIIWQSIEASLSPWIYEKLNEGEKNSVRKLTADIVLLFAVMCLGCTLLAPEIMKVLAPVSYSAGIYVIPPVAAGVFFTAIYSIYMRIELFYKQTDFATIATTLAAALNVVLNYVFIRICGAVAAGYTTMICYALLALLHYLNVRKKGFSDIINNKMFMSFSAAVVIGVIVISLLYNYLVIRIILIMTAGVLVFWKRKTIIGLIKMKKRL